MLIVEIVDIMETGYTVVVVVVDMAGMVVPDYNLMVVLDYNVVAADYNLVVVPDYNLVVLDYNKGMVVVTDSLS